MVGETEQRRAELRERLLDIAEVEIRDHGFASLRARSLAEKADCAVGAIYNVFDDMTGLILAVNMRTFRRLGDVIHGTLATEKTPDPVEQLIAIADAYVDFANDNPNLWRAFFGIELTQDSDVPDWYMHELERLFLVISKPFAALDPQADEDEIMLRTRGLYSAVHGIMMLSFERRIASIPHKDIKPMIFYILRNASQPREL